MKDLVSRVLSATGYAQALAQEDTHESQDRLENLAELLSAAAEYEARSEDPNLTGFLDQVSLLADTDMVRDDAPVVLMTLHSAKGLEYDVVFLVGLEEGLMPHVRSLEREDAIEEERRLVYVGMTRARERLFLSWAQSRQVFGQRRTSQPSRFLEELPRERMEISGEESRSAAWTRGGLVAGSGLRARARARGSRAGRSRRSRRRVAAELKGDPPGGQGAPPDVRRGHRGAERRLRRRPQADGVVPRHRRQEARGALRRPGSVVIGRAGVATFTGERREGSLGRPRGPPSRQPGPRGDEFISAERAGGLGGPTVGPPSSITTPAGGSGSPSG